MRSFDGPDYYRSSARKKTEGELQVGWGHGSVWKKKIWRTKENLGRYREVGFDILREDAKMTTDQRKWRKTAESSFVPYLNMENIN